MAGHTDGPPTYHLSHRQRRRIHRLVERGRILEAQRIILADVYGTSHHALARILRGWL